MRLHIQALLILAALVLCCGTAEAGSRYVDQRSLIPVYPPYPYRAGHYPKADWYYQLPPYAAIVPRFYRKRYFMMAQERNRYRYMPHIFRGYNADYDIDYEGDQNVSYEDVSPVTIEDLSIESPTKPKP
ncbi:MAG TPA: hypothetical protein VHK26_07785 [Methyloceanibacter sp.]|jgi:hypothetical protein|nr:hypothetical protein [Methyloceanibacter sp.]